MAIVTIFLLLFFILGVSLGPLLLGVLIVAFSRDRSQRLAAWTIGLGLTSIYRPAITFNARDELTLKRRAYDEKHDAEYIAFGGVLSKVKRYLHDPQARIHSFYGVPFGFVEELFGVVVDPRDAALGRELRVAQANSQYEHRVERGGRLHESVRAVFELPRGGMGVRLPEVIYLFGGSFDSQLVDRVRDYYEKSQAPRDNRSSLKRLALPIGAFVAVVLMGVFAAGQGAGGGGGGGGAPAGNSSTINVGASLLFLLLSLPSIPRPPRPSAPDPPDVNWRDLFVALVTIAIAGLLMVGLYLVFPMPVAILGIPLPLWAWTVIALAIGLALIPFVAFWFGRSLGALGMGLGKLYLILGLLGFSRPVIAYDEGEYRVVEYDDHYWPVEPSWYRFAMTRLGVGFLNFEDNWPDGTTLSRSRVKALGDEATTDTPAPTGYTATELIAVDDVHGFVPDDPAEETVYVRTDRTTGWYLDAGQDVRLMTTSLEHAKEDFGGGASPLGDGVVLAATLGAIVIGALFNWLVIL